jgi:hypothetical protein
VGFMNSINKLRAENDELKKDAAATETEQQHSTQRSLIIIIGLLVAVLYLLRLKFVKRNV